MPEYTKYRKHNKVYDLPNNIRAVVDQMLLDTSITYLEIVEWLKSECYDISKSTLGRYALDTKKLSFKLMEAREHVNELARIAKETDGENLAEAAMQFSIQKLTEKIALADVEIDKMKITDAIRLSTSIARTKAYKDKVYATLKSDYDKAYAVFLKQLNKELEGHPDVIVRLTDIANDTLGKALA